MSTSGSIEGNLCVESSTELCESDSESSASSGCTVLENPRYVASHCYINGRSVEATLGFKNASSCGGFAALAKSVASLGDRESYNWGTNSSPIQPFKCDKPLPVNSIFWPRQKPLTLDEALELMRNKSRPFVKVNTGEEGELVKFKKPAKLYRFAPKTKEYKELGEGDLKILFNEDKNRCRIVMRRNTVFKVCVNAPIMEGMKITKLHTDLKSCLWLCKNYANREDGENEWLAAKFKEADLVHMFAEVFDNAAAGKYRSPE